jgi:hypothetical protein
LLNAVEASREAGAALNRAVAYVHLGDMRRERGKLGPALTDYRRAQRIFRWQSTCRQRHNEAVAAYALGLVHHLLGSELDALKWYEKSTKLLGTARDHWVTTNDLPRVDACSRLERWIDILSEHVTRGLTQQETDPSPGIWVPVVLAARRGSYVEQVEVQEQDGELVGRINRFRVHPLEDDWSIQLAPQQGQYGAQEMPKKTRWTLHASRGDHALIQWGDRLGRKERARMEELDQAHTGDFLRDEDGRIYVIPPDPTIIGGWGDTDRPQNGHIAALLEPTTSCDEAVPSQEEAEHAAAEESSDDVMELYKELVGLLRGSEDTADSLIEYERKLAPDATTYELIDRAIGRLLRDRRSTS